MNRPPSPPSPPSGGTLLYNVMSDPGEHNDVSAQNPAIVARLTVGPTRSNPRSVVRSVVAASRKIERMDNLFGFELVLCTALVERGPMGGMCDVLRARACVCVHGGGGLGCQLTRVGWCFAGRHQRDAGHGTDCARRPELHRFVQALVQVSVHASVQAARVAQRGRLWRGRELA